MRGMGTLIGLVVVTALATALLMPGTAEPAPPGAGLLSKYREYSFKLHGFQTLKWTAEHGSSADNCHTYKLERGLVQTRWRGKKGKVAGISPTGIAGASEASGTSLRSYSVRERTPSAGADCLPCGPTSEFGPCGPGARELAAPANDCGQRSVEGFSTLRMVKKGKRFRHLPYYQSHKAPLSLGLFSVDLLASQPWRSCPAGLGSMYETTAERLDNGFSELDQATAEIRKGKVEEIRYREKEDCPTRMLPGSPPGDGRPYDVECTFERGFSGYIKRTR